MELDDFKNVWSETVAMKSKTLSYERIRQILNSISGVKKRLSNRFKIEISIASIFYIGFLVVVLLFKDSVQLFIYKLVAVTLFFATPIYYRLYKTIQFLNKIDYGRDLKSNIVEFLIYYKTTLLFYRWGLYSMILVLMVLFLTDASFLRLSNGLQGIIISYLLLVLFASRSLIKKFYGKDIKSIEAFLKE